MTDIRATRETNDRGEITNIGKLRSKYNNANGLTKIMLCNATDNIILNDHIDCMIEQ